MTQHMHHSRLPLQDMALAPSTTKAYTKQLNNFLRYSRISIQRIYSLPAHKLDHALALFIQHSYDSNLPYTYASHALHALVFYRPELKHGGLHQARACLKGWERVKKSLSHPPLTWELTVLIACTMSHAGFHAPAVAMLVGFDCYLRVSELTGLRRKDIVMPHDARMGRAHSKMAVCLPETKTGPNQSVDVQRSDVATLLCSWVKSLPSSVGPTDRIFDFSPQWLGRLIRNSCIELGLGHIPYVPHSLRHGGATTDYLTTGSVKYVHHRGRWKSIESLRTYVQTARALLAAQDVPPHLNKLGQLFSDNLVEVLSDCQHNVAEVVPRGRGRRVTFQA